LACTVRLGRYQRSGAVQIFPNFSPPPPPILETLRLENEGEKDLPAEVELDILPENATSLRALCSRCAPLAIEPITTTHRSQPSSFFITLSISPRCWAFWRRARGRGLAEPSVQGSLPSLITRKSHDGIRQFGFLSRKVEPLLAALRAPPTTDLNTQVRSGSPHTPLHEVLPSSLDGLPGVARTTSL